MKAKWAAWAYAEIWLISQKYAAAYHCFLSPKILFRTAALQVLQQKTFPSFINDDSFNRPYPGLNYVKHIVYLWTSELWKGWFHSLRPMTEKPNHG